MPLVHWSRPTSCDNGRPPREIAGIEVKIAIDRSVDERRRHCDYLHLGKGNDELLFLSGKLRPRNAIEAESVWGGSTYFQGSGSGWRLACDRCLMQAADLRRCIVAPLNRARKLRLAVLLLSASSHIATRETVLAVSPGVIGGPARLAEGYPPLTQAADICMGIAGLKIDDGFAILLVSNLRILSLRSINTARLVIS